MSSLTKYYFNAHGNSAPAYSCNLPGDNTGHYYQSADVDDLLDELRSVVRAAVLHGAATGNDPLVEVDQKALARLRGENQ
jgi:hypothetical protein